MFGQPREQLLKLFRLSWIDNILLTLLLRRVYSAVRNSNILLTLRFQLFYQLARYPALIGEDQPAAF